MRRYVLSALTCALVLINTQVFASELVEGKNFRSVNPAVATTEDHIEVIDFFAYTCGHCLRLAPLLDEWQKKLPPDVSFRRVPVSWEPATQFLSRIFYTFEALNRLEDLHPIFWQDIMDGKITSEAGLQDWLKSHKVNLTEWNKTYQSFSVTMKTQQALQTWQNYQLDATPYVAVGGKYLTAPHLAGSRQKTIEVLNALIKRERQQRQNH